MSRAEPGPRQLRPSRQLHELQPGAAPQPPDPLHAPGRAGSCHGPWVGSPVPPTAREVSAGSGLSQTLPECVSNNLRVAGTPHGHLGQPRSRSRPLWPWWPAGTQPRSGALCLEIEPSRGTLTVKRVEAVLSWAAAWNTALWVRARKTTWTHSCAIPDKAWHEECPARGLSQDSRLGFLGWGLVEALGLASSWVLGRATQP